MVGFKQLAAEQACSYLRLPALLTVLYQILPVPLANPSLPVACVYGPGS